MTKPNISKRAAPATGCCFSLGGMDSPGEGGRSPARRRRATRASLVCFGEAETGCARIPRFLRACGEGMRLLGCAGGGVGLMGRAPASPPRRALRLRRSRRLRRRPRLRRGPGGEAAVCSTPCRLPMRPAASADPAAPLDGVGHRSYNGSMHKTGGTEGEKPE